MSYWSKRRKVSKVLSEMESRLLEEQSSEDEVDMHSKQTRLLEIFEERPSEDEVELHSQQTQDTGEEDPSYSFHNSCDSTTRDSISTGTSCGSDDGFSAIENDETQVSTESDDATENCNSKQLSLLLQAWAVECEVRHATLKRLLSILRLFHPTLPKHPKTLLKTSPVDDLQFFDGGSYYHFGLKHKLMQQLSADDYLRSSSEIKLQLNIDGLPLFKSSRLQLWPILAMVVGFPCSKEPFAIGIYAGDNKPTNPTTFLKQFVEEMKVLSQEGLDYNGRNYKVRLINIVCDAQARVFVKQVKSCSGYSGCDKCTQSGVHDGQKMIFPETDAPLRTDRTFDEKIDEAHHKGENPFQGLQLGMVSQFPIDYMHLVCLGVVKRLISLWLSGPLSVRIRGRIQDLISDNLKSLQSSIPREFARKPRPIFEYARWKATEFRQFLLYTGLIVLHGNVANEVYENFTLLSVAIRLLIDPANCHKNADFAQTLLVNFVQHYSRLYGLQNVVYNVHALVHLVNDVRNYGALDNFSSFPYENYLQKLKRLVRKGNNVMQQLILRLQEKAQYHPGLVNSHNCATENSHPSFKRKHCCGPVPSFCSGFEQYHLVHLEKFTLSTNEPDNCVRIGSSIAVILNFLKEKSQFYVVYKKFCSVEPFFTYPLNSLALGISLLKNLSRDVQVGDITDIKGKLVLLPWNNCSVAFPLIL